MDRPRALVIGGSLGGLFAAHLLRSIGWDVAVFERSKADLADRGLGLGTRPELFEVMRRIDIDLDPSIGVEVRSRIGLDRNGEVMCEVPVRGVATAWDRIYRALKTALPSEFYRSGMQLERFEQETRTVTAIFADGLRVEGDLLVGADGIHSTVRRQLLPEVNPRYAGYVNWRGVVEEGDWTTAINSMVFQHMTFCFPDGEMALSIPMAASCGHAHQARRRCAFGWMRPVDYGVPLRHMCTDADGHHHGETIPPPLIRPELITELKDSAVASLAPQIAALVARGEQPILQPIYDLESPCLAFGRAVLVGDAAFVARPHVGTGVTKAALDAQCLADALLGAKNDIEAALTHYDRERRRSGMAVVARGRYLGRLLEIGSKPRKPRTAGESRRHAETVIREFGSGGAIGGDPNNAREGDSAEQDA